MNGRSRLLSSLGLAVALSILVGCSKKPVADDVIARIGDREVRVPEFVSLHGARQQRNPAPLDPKVFLDEIIAREVLVQAARKEGLDKDPEIQDLIRDVLAAKLKERVLAPQLEAVSITDTEIRADYEASKAEFAIPERIRIAMLSLRATGSSLEAVRQRMEIALGRAQQTSNPAERGFGALSVEFSDDQETRYRGGDLGWVERERFPGRIEPKVIEAAFALKQSGEISGLITGEHGVYVVKRLDFQPSSTAPLEKVEPAIRARLLRKKREEIEANYLAKLRTSVPVEVHAERIPSIAGAPGTSLPPRLP